MTTMTTTSVTAYYSPQYNPFQTCQAQRAMNQTSIRNGQSAFYLYNLADRTKCAGRVPHPYVPETLQAVGWVSCSSADAIKVKLTNASPTYSAGQYVGCYRDFDIAYPEDRLDIAIPVLLSSSLAVNGYQHDQCRDLAAAGGYTVYGIRYNNKCYAGKDFGHALRYGSVGTCATQDVNSYGCCFSCGAGCMTGTHRSNAVYTMNAAKSPYPPPLPNQIFGDLGSSQMLGKSSPYSGVMTNALPYMSNSDTWSRLEVEGTGEIIVAAAYRYTQNSGTLTPTSVLFNFWSCTNPEKSDGTYDY